MREAPIADPNNPGVTGSRFAARDAATYKSTKDGDIAIVHLADAPGATKETALFLPKGFDPSKPAILVPYFHGHGGSIPDSFERQKLAELAAKSGKNIAFVIPQLGSKSEITQDFRNPATAAKFLDEAADGLGKLYAHNHPEADAAKATKAFHDMPVVTMTYSGGYQAAWSTLKLPKVKGALVLDSMYGTATPFIDFSKRPDAPFVAVKYGPSTEGHAREFVAGAAKGHFSVKPNPSDHGSLVQTALADTLQSLNVSPDGQVTYNGLSDKTPLASAAPVRPVAPTA